MKRVTGRWGILAWMLMASLAAGVSAQGRLTDVKSLSCSFPVIATGTWTDGNAEGRVGGSRLTVRFGAIDMEAATSVVDAGLPITEVDTVEPYGPSHLITRVTDDYLHFIQMFTAGVLFTTTVINRETVGGKLMAVHTRHVYADAADPSATTRPEQYYGDCEVGR